MFVCISDISQQPDPVYFSSLPLSKIVHSIVLYLMKPTHLTVLYIIISIYFGVVSSLRVTKHTHQIWCPAWHILSPSPCDKSGQKVHSVHNLSLFHQWHWQYEYDLSFLFLGSLTALFKPPLWNHSWKGQLSIPNLEGTTDLSPISPFFQNYCKELFSSTPWPSSGKLFLILIVISKLVGVSLSQLWGWSWHWNSLALSQTNYLLKMIITNYPLKMIITFQSILLSHLILNTTFGLSGSVLSCFLSYLSDCTQTVSINGSWSVPTVLQFGVPQRSVLGPVNGLSSFFAFNLSLLTSVSHHCLFHHSFCDDNQFYASAHLSELHRIPSSSEACISDVQARREWFSSLRNIFRKPRLCFWLCHLPCSWMVPTYLCLPLSQT